MHAADNSKQKQKAGLEPFPTLSRVALNHGLLCAQDIPSRRLVITNPACLLDRANGEVGVRPGRRGMVRRLRWGAKSPPICAGRGPPWLAKRRYGWVVGRQARSRVTLLVPTNLRGPCESCDWCESIEAATARGERRAGGGVGGSRRRAVALAW